MLEVLEVLEVSSNEGASKIVVKLKGSEDGSSEVVWSIATDDEELETLRLDLDVIGCEEREPDIFEMEQSPPTNDARFLADSDSKRSKPLLEGGVLEWLTAQLAVSGGVSRVVKEFLQPRRRLEELEEKVEELSLKAQDRSITGRTTRNYAKTRQGSECSGERVDRQASLQDFVLIRVIGKGSFGKVMLVKKKTSNKLFAMKVLNKGPFPPMTVGTPCPKVLLLSDNVIRRKQVEHTLTERSILEYAKHPFIVSLHYAFQSKSKLFLVMDYLAGGELFFHLGKSGRFCEDRARFYAAEIVLALEYLHESEVVYRDLKPENVLISVDGHVALSDFGLSKEGVTDNSSSFSFCGTPEYLAPEVLTRSGHGLAADWWSLGTLLFEMLVGMPPFYCKNRDKLFHKILSGSLNIPRFVSDEAKSLLSGLLTLDIESRLGSQHGSEEIKRHPFFKSIDWKLLYEKNVETPFLPSIQNLTDVENFDTEFTNMPVIMSAGKSVVSPKAAGMFHGFTFDHSVDEQFDFDDFE